MGQLCSGIPCPAGGFAAPSFRAVSWNVLTPRQKDWSRRRPQILDRLRCADADLVALQEALPRALGDSLDAGMSALGYTAHHCEPDVEGIEPPLLYVRRSVFRVTWEDAHSRSVLAALQPVGFQGPPVYVANVHLMASPSEGLARLYQVRKVLRRLAVQAAPSKGGTLCPPDVPMLLLGDFNEAAGEGKALPTLLTDGFPPAGAGEVPNPKGEWATCSFEDAHLALLGDKAPATWPCPGPTARIDYLLHTDSLSCRGVPTPLAPEEDYPSDHLMIGADFRLGSDEEEDYEDSDD